MIKECLAAGLPEPHYYYDMSGFWVEFRKDIYNEEYLKSIGLNERQIKAVLYVKEHDFITNAEYREINETKQTLSSEELGEIVEKGILKSSGAKGRGAKYFLKK